MFLNIILYFLIENRPQIIQLKQNFEQLEDESFSHSYNVALN